MRALGLWDALQEKLTRERQERAATAGLSQLLNKPAPSSNRAKGLWKKAKSVLDQIHELKEMESQMIKVVLAALAANRKAEKERAERATKRKQQFAKQRRSLMKCVAHAALPPPPPPSPRAAPPLIAGLPRR